MNNEKQYLALCSKYEIDYCRGIKSAQDLKRDVEYFEEYASRHKISTGINFEVLSCCAKQDFYWMGLYPFLKNHRKDEKIMTKIFIVRDLLIAMFSKLFDKDQELNDEVLKDILELSSLTEYDFGITIQDYAAAFESCNHRLKKLKKAIDKIKTGVADAES